jgi:FtsP/CotA-like multicopper oxidase with cupredoxin domain
MSLGVIVGFAFAFPANVWMVMRKLKHGLMTERGTTRSAEAGAHQHSRHQRGRANGGAGHSMVPKTTRPQLATVTGISVLFLAAGMVLPALSVNLRLGAGDVGGSIMPPGMIMSWDTPAASMRDMSAVLPRYVSHVAPPDARGDTPLMPRMENGVKVFDLETSVIRWTILSGVTVEAYAFNRQVPGPRIRVTEGDRVRINVTNRLPEPTTVHWHGLILPNAMDGPAEITQKPIATGDTFRYEFTTEQAGTYFYHTHAHVDRQQSLGLYGALIIDPKNSELEAKADAEYVIQLQEWLQRAGLTYPAMLMEGAFPNYFTINGKAYPSTDTIRLKIGQTVKLRFIGSNNNFIHPMHVHGGPFTVIARDGQPLPPQARFDADTVNVGPGQRYDVVWRAREPGKWLIHCHIGHHTTNNNTETQGGGGLTMVIEVTT